MLPYTTCCHQRKGYAAAESNMADGASFSSFKRLTKICPGRPNEMDLALPCKETNQLEGHQEAVRAVRFNYDGTTV